MERPAARVDGRASDNLLVAYAKSKAEGEALVRGSGLPAVIARVSAVIGDSVTGEIARLQTFQYLIGAAMRGLILFFPTEPGNRADLIPQDVVAAAIAVWLDRKRSPRVQTDVALALQVSAEGAPAEAVR